MRGPTETIYRIALHAFHLGTDFFGNYNGVFFEKACLDPIDFKSYDHALTIAKIQCINIANDPEFTGKRLITIDKFTKEGETVNIVGVARIYIEGKGYNPTVEEIS